MVSVTNSDAGRTLGQLIFFFKDAGLSGLSDSQMWRMVNPSWLHVITKNCKFHPLRKYVWYFFVVNL